MGYLYIKLACAGHNEVLLKSLADIKQYSQDTIFESKLSASSHCNVLIASALQINAVTEKTNLRRVGSKVDNTTREKSSGAANGAVATLDHMSGRHYLQCLKKFAKLCRATPFFCLRGKSTWSSVG